MKIKLLTASYILLLATIIYMADHMRYQSLFSIIRSVPGADKLGHFLLMGLLSFLLNVSLGCRSIRIAGKLFLLGSVIVIALVTLEEFSQLFIRYRTFDLIDLAADYTGIWIFGRLARQVIEGMRDEKDSQ